MKGLSAGSSVVYKRGCVYILLLMLFLTANQSRAEPIKSILEEAGVLHLYEFNLPPSGYEWTCLQGIDGKLSSDVAGLDYYYSLFFFDPWPPVSYGMVSPPHGGDGGASQSAGTSVITKSPPDENNYDNTREAVYNAYGRNGAANRTASVVTSYDTGRLTWHKPAFWIGCFNYSPSSAVYYTSFSSNSSSPAGSNRKYHFYSPAQNTASSGAYKPGQSQPAPTGGTWNKSTTSRYSSDERLKKIFSTVGTTSVIPSDTSAVRYPKGYRMNKSVKVSPSNKPLSSDRPSQSNNSSSLYKPVPSTKRSSSYKPVPSTKRSSSYKPLPSRKRSSSYKPSSSYRRSSSSYEPLPSYKAPSYTPNPSYTPSYGSYGRRSTSPSYSPYGGAVSPYSSSSRTPSYGGSSYGAVSGTYGGRTSRY